MTHIAEGGQTRTQRVDSTKVEYDAIRYGSEIGFTEEMLVGNRLSMFVTSIEQLRTAYQRAISDSHYSVLATASVTGTGSQITHQGNTNESQLSRDIKTINAGLALIESDLKDVAPEEVESGSYILYVQGIALKGRAVAAVAATLNSLTIERSGRDTSAPVQRGVMVASTLNSNVPANKGIMCLAGRKLQTADAGARSPTRRSIPRVRTCAACSGHAGASLQPTPGRSSNSRSPRPPPRPTAQARRLSPAGFLLVW